MVDQVSPFETRAKLWFARPSRVCLAASADHKCGSYARIPPGGSDPYCIFILGDEEIRSKCCENTNNPVWEPPDEFVMSVPDARYYLRILLYDKGDPNPSSPASAERNAETRDTFGGRLRVRVWRR